MENSDPSPSRRNRLPVPRPFFLLMLLLLVSLPLRGDSCSSNTNPETGFTPEEEAQNSRDDELARVVRQRDEEQQRQQQQAQERAELSAERARRGW